MDQNERQITFSEEEFTLSGAERHRGLYFPLMSETGLKGAVTPDLRGDLKIDQNHFLLEPASIRDLSESLSSRNFWCDIKTPSGERFLWSATGCSHHQRALSGTEQREEVNVTAGFLWQRVERISREMPLSSHITSFIPPHRNTELHLVTIENRGEETIHLRFTAAIPLYGRSADNLRDHRHVTSLLHRIFVKKDGVYLCPTMSFDERGHKLNETVYFVRGIDGAGREPETFYPTEEDFVGEEGDLFSPEALVKSYPGVKSGASVNGKEALGGLCFSEQPLPPKEKLTFVIGTGIGETEDFPKNPKEAENLLEETKAYWRSRVGITFATGEEELDTFLWWVSLQPEMRRIFGCSFLPHHDYGRGGRGWRDLWQDCLALLLSDPSKVRPLLINNCGGIRLDGTNATIIGDGPGEFKADRNAIKRVWMDHGMWPLMTVKLYLDETGDFSILREEAPYFKDDLTRRGEGRDEDFKGEDTRQRTTRGEELRGSVLEHLLIQNLTAAGDLGDHEILRLRGADWNDALDMAAENGESVAFSFAFIKNLLDLSEILKALSERGTKAISLPKEMVTLLHQGEGENILAEHRSRLSAYMEAVEKTVSGEREDVPVERLLSVLIDLSEGLKAAVQKEWIITPEGYGYFNSYYDNNRRRAEGFAGENGILRMMLTGQVFAIMSGVATPEQVKEIIKSSDDLLYDPDCGGYRLNTDFGEIKTDMGRMFGFAYGEKENGAVFSHMAVMYANALYSRGEWKAGEKALLSLYRQAGNRQISHIYPGIPEYFDQNGRGLYHYLTGAASWLLLTMRTMVYGVSGHFGDLEIQPVLSDIFFREDNTSSVRFRFAERSFSLCVKRGDTEGKELYLNGEPVQGRIDRSRLLSLDKEKEHEILCIIKQ